MPLYTRVEAYGSLLILTRSRKKESTESYGCVVAEFDKTVSDVDRHSDRVLKVRLPFRDGYSPPLCSSHTAAAQFNSVSFYGELCLRRPLLRVKAANEKPIPNV